MSRNLGRRKELLLAEYLRQWWPSAEAPPPSRPGSDVLGIPGTVWENKTAKRFDPQAFVRQARSHRVNGGEIPITVYWPERAGEESAGVTLAIVPLRIMVHLLHDAGYGNTETL